MCETSLSGRRIDEQLAEPTPPMWLYLSVINEQAGKLIRNTPVKVLKAKRMELKNIAKKNKQSLRKILRDAWLCPLTFDECAVRSSGVRGSIQLKLGIVKKNEAKKDEVVLGDTGNTGDGRNPWLAVRNATIWL